MRPPPSAWKLASEDDSLPDASDLKAQFWSQEFRTRMRQAGLLEKRPLADVSWAAFPAVAETIRKRGNVSRAEVEQLQDFVLTFMVKLVGRLGQKNDMETLEACSVFDPRPSSKQMNSGMRSNYINHLCVLFSVPLSQRRDILSGAVSWFSAQDAFDEKHDTDGAHFGRLYQHSALIKHFALFALSNLKNLFANANVEARFSTVTLCKSKHRSTLKSDKIKGYLVGRTLQDLSKVSFPDLWDKLKPWMHNRGHLIQLRGKYNMSEPTEQHGVWNSFAFDN